MSWCSPLFLARLRERGLRAKDLYSLWRMGCLKLRYGKRVHFAGLSVGLGPSTAVLIDKHASVRFGELITIRKRSDIEVYETGIVEIGNRVFINKNCTIVCRKSVSIGNDCMFGVGVSVYDHDFQRAVSSAPFRAQGFVSKPVRIGNNVWIGAHCFIRAGVTIGDNVVVGAGTVVTKDIPAGTTAYNRGNLQFKPLEISTESGNTAG